MSRASEPSRSSTERSTGDRHTCEACAGCPAAHPCGSAAAGPRDGDARRRRRPPTRRRSSRRLRPLPASLVLVDLPVDVVVVLEQQERAGQGERSARSARERGWSALGGTCVRKIGGGADGRDTNICTYSGTISETRILEPMCCASGCKESCVLAVDGIGVVGGARAGRSHAVGANTAGDGCYAWHTLLGWPDPGSAGARSAHGEVRHRRRRPAVRHDGPGREQERRAADPRVGDPHRRRGCRSQRPAHQRRRRDAAHPRSDRRRSRVARAQRGRAVRRRGPRGGDRPRAGGADQGVVPARRPAARALSAAP